MRGAHQVTGTATEIVAAGKAWSLGIIHNVSDSTVYVQWTNDGTITTALGMPILAGEKLTIIPTSTPTRAAVTAIQGAGGNKEVRYAFE